MRPVHTICDPHDCTLQSEQVGTGASRLLLPPADFHAFKRASLLLQAIITILGLGFELLAAGQLVSPRSARFDRIEAPEPLHLAYFRFYHDFLFLSLCFFVLC